MINMTKESFKKMKETESASEIFGKVVHSDTFIKVMYKYNGTPFYLEFPKRPVNGHLEVGDDVELELNLFVGLI